MLGQELVRMHVKKYDYSEAVSGSGHTAESDGQSPCVHSLGLCPWLCSQTAVR